MDYDNIFDDNINRDFFFNKKGYPTNILMEGFISVDNAKERLSRGEYYTLVVYQDQPLPEGYIPIDSNIIESMGIESENKFATIRPDLDLGGISRDGGIQVISSILAPEGDARYLLDPGPDKVLLSDLVYGQLEAYKNSNRKIR